MRTTKLRASLTEASKIFSEADVDDSGTLSFAEYKVLPHNAAVDDAELRAGFAELDHDGSGTIDKHEYLLETSS